MHWKSIFFAVFALSGVLSLSAEEVIADTGDLPSEIFEDATDPYLEGYIQALVDVSYYEYRVIVKVRNHKVFIYNLPRNELLANSIVDYVRGLPGVKEVVVQGDFTREELGERLKYVEQPRISGIWFPQSTVLFQPLLADPRQPIYSVAYRYGDRVIGKNVIGVSLGDDFPIYRWRDVFRWHGDLQIGIEGAVWTVFNFSNIPDRGTGESCELVNADYYVGIPVTYAAGRWSFRLRAYHISSHLGDEFLVNNPSFLDNRVNPSFETLDFFPSYQWGKHARLYAGVGYIVHSDHSFPMEHWYVQYGMELRVGGKPLYYHRLYGTPFIAVHFENWQVRNWGFDVFLKFGYEISKMQGVGRKMRAYINLHHGYSYEGQFFLLKTDYAELGFSWGF